MFCSSASSYHETSPDTSGKTSWYNEATGGGGGGGGNGDTGGNGEGVTPAVVTTAGCGDGGGLGQFRNRVGGIIP